jgi:hypothetical protein
MKHLILLICILIATISFAFASDDVVILLNDAAGDSIESSTAGDTITLMIVDSSKIVVLDSYGTWSDAN